MINIRINDFFLIIKKYNPGFLLAAMVEFLFVQVFVETLDKCFENVCELDLIFHVDRVHFILQEIVMGGMVLETNMQEILLRVNEQDKIEKQEVCQSDFYPNIRMHLSPIFKSWY